MILQKYKKHTIKGELKNCTYLPGDLDFLTKMEMFCFDHYGKNSLFSQVKGELSITFWRTALSHAKNMQGE